MRAVAASVVNDLRQRKLLPVAILLLVVTLALPVVAMKSASEPAATPTAGTATTAQPAGGLPTPEEALSGDKPLVSLAVLEGDSNLDEFESKNPFKPLDKVSADGATPIAPIAPVPSDMAGGSTPSPSTGGGSGSGGSTGGTGGGSGGGSGGGGSDQPAATPTPTPTPDAPTQNDGGTTPKTEKKLTYAVDLTIRGPKGLRRYRGLPKLSVLPAQDNPLLVFLGVEDSGTKAVFLVDAKLRSKEGEGTCTPSPEQCATLALAPGEEHTLINDAGQTWTILIAEVREITVAKAAAAARMAQRRQARKATTAVGDKPVPRFLPPMITDLFTGGRS